MNSRPYILVGAGGTGSLLLQPLMRYLSGYHQGREEHHVIAIIDGDHVEAKNLARQMFTGNVVDENKATALATLHDDGTLRPIPEFLGDDNITRRLADGDTVLICADNYDVRARIEALGKTFQDFTVINGGNESVDGSVQIWLRRNGDNVTPPMSFMHAEILRPSPFDPSKLSCAERAELPGGGQTIVANMMSATQMLNAIRKVHDWEEGNIQPLLWHEIQFDLQTGNARSYDWRSQDGWKS